MEKKDLTQVPTCEYRCQSFFNLVFDFVVDKLVKKNLTSLALIIIN